MKLFLTTACAVALLAVLTFGCTEETTTPDADQGQSDEAVEPGLQGFSEAECAYLSAVAQQADDISNAMSTLGELMTSSDTFSDEWTIRVATQLAIVQVTQDQSTELVPPPGLEAVNSEWLAATAAADQSANLVAEGIDEFNADKIGAATTLMTDSGNRSSAAGELIGAFGATRSGNCA